ncbi:hypothetical protein [Occallatibacter riparius]|uniref:Uncharacterized protein n=1 Tax=Occallatibacter riparius TaxID=1002689 RepID=A0A9J7BS11_9BACT|nr:hypothetical protein [Occallatibacter riparius]UWZ85361.1 hypothetical protein MOP44_05330 [Occallatibacter riparius]
MNRDERERNRLDAILAEEGEIVPSSGFLARVMEKVEDEVTAPPPIPFPWKRFLPGFVLAGGVLGWGAVETVRYASQAAAGGFVLPKIQMAAALSEPMQQAGWVVGALAVSGASWLLSRRIAGRSGIF